MNRVFLCGHTGSINRGCDAIVRATADILKKESVNDISLLTFAHQQDMELQLHKEVQLIPYPVKPWHIRAASLFMRKVAGNGVWGQRYLYGPLMGQADTQDILFNIGGDTYCYGTPYISYALNEMAAENKIPTVFWGCSVEERLCTDAKMRRDVNRYSHIVARERLSYDILKHCVEDSQKVHFACDPAFTLEPEAVSLPDGFLPGHTIGINISPLVCRDPDDPDDMMYRNVCCLIDYILEKTSMNVCLIPHVYDPVSKSGDSKVLGYVYSRYTQHPRVSLVNSVFNSRQLKYIISQCRFFVGARTHAMIAAYSSGVPALALSYSVKSLGIAGDLLGSSEEYAIPWQNIDRTDYLCDAFMCAMYDQESAIRQRYDLVLADYCGTMANTTKKIMEAMKE